MFPGLYLSRTLMRTQGNFKFSPARRDLTRSSRLGTRAMALDLVNGGRTGRTKGVGDEKIANPWSREKRKTIDVPFYDNNYLLIFTLACKVLNKFKY